MKVVKVRRVGNSNVISLPRELEASGFVPGTSVVVDEGPDGALRVMRTDQVQETVFATATRLAADHAEALGILDEHDRRGEVRSRSYDDA